MKYLPLLLFLISLSVQAYSQNDTARVEGIILDKNDVGINGVVVDALLNGKKKRFAISDVDGKFMLDSLKVNQRYQFDFSHNDYKGKNIVKTTNDSTLLLDTILLDEKLSLLRGNVIVHQDDDPSDVEIIISQIDDVFHPLENGDFEIIDLPSGSYNIEIRHLFYDLVTRTISIAPNDTVAIDTIDLLSGMKESKIKVIVDFTNNGNGTKEDIKIFSDNEYLGNTNEDGILETSIERGDHTILAELNNYISNSSSFSVNPGELDSVLLNLEFKNGVIEGVVQLDTILKISIEDVNISIEENDTIYHPDSEGYYSILNLAPGDYTVNASLQNYLSDNTTATVNKDTTSVDSNMVLRLIRGRVEGKITLSDDTDGEITDVLVELINTDESSNDTINTRSNNNGYYWFDFVKDGKYKITAGLKHFENKSSEHFSINMDIPEEDTIAENLTLEYEYGKLEVLIKDFYKSDEIEDAEIVLTGILNNKDTIYTSDNQGKVVIGHLYQEQEIALSIKKNNFIDVDTAINIIGGDNKLEIKLKQIPSIIIEQSSVVFDRPLVIDSISKTPESFEIELEYLTEDLLVMAPSNFLISKNRDENYGNNLLFDSNNGEPETIHIFVKLKPVKSDSIFEDIIVSTNYYNQKSKSTSIKVIGEGLEPLSIIIEKLNSEDDTVCIGSSISLRADVSGGREEYTYLWKDINSNISDDSIVFESGPINANNSKIVLLVTDRYNNQASKIVEINHYKVPSTELDMKGADPGILLFTKEFDYKYQWYKDSVILEGETGQYYYPGGDENGASWNPGDYYVVLTNEHQCETSSIIISKEAVKSAILEQSFFINNELFDDLLVYPNPTNETVFIYSEDLLNKKDTRIVVSNIYGKIVQEHLLKGEIISSSFEISLKGNIPGIYLITISNDEKSNTSKIILK